MIFFPDVTMGITQPFSSFSQQADDLPQSTPTTPIALIRRYGITGGVSCIIATIHSVRSRIDALLHCPCSSVDSLGVVNDGIHAAGLMTGNAYS